MINPIDNSNIEWKKGYIVDSIGGNFKNGEIVGIKKENDFTILTIKWEGDFIQSRSDRTVRKI